ncbi:hypothetical protein, partial [Escherichia coli]|uniref:hypothetical protein n=1 Tax=Escherichia coli TaxID=562 RepID=UPI001485A6CC
KKKKYKKIFLITEKKELNKKEKKKVGRWQRGVVWTGRSKDGVEMGGRRAGGGIAALRKSLPVT